MTISTWRMSLARCDSVLANLRQRQATLRRFGYGASADYWQADIDRVEARRLEILAWQASQEGR